MSAYETDASAGIVGGAPNAACCAADAFTVVLGDGRGPQDVLQLRQALATSDGHTRALTAQLQRAHRSEVRLRGRVDELTQRLDDTTAAATSAHADAHALRLARDRARYRLVLAGHTDEGCGDEFWQGLFSPQRAYLAGQVVAHAGRLWRCETGAPPSSCFDAERFSCLSTAGVAAAGVGLVGRTPATGPADRMHARLWQERLWWDKSGAAHELSAMPASHLHGVVVWLVARRKRLHFEDLAASAAHIDGDLSPANPFAYPDARAWLLDTPLLRALIRTRADMLGRKPGGRTA